jgi:hypothetical protein
LHHLIISLTKFECEPHKKRFSSEKSVYIFNSVRSRDLSIHGPRGSRSSRGNRRTREYSTIPKIEVCNWILVEAVNLALKVFHHDPIALAIYRPLAEMYYPETENEVILHALNMIRNKGCIFSLFARNDYLVSLKAAFPLENPAAPVPIVGIYMRYTAMLGVVEDGKHSQKNFFFVKVLRELAHLMIYYFNKANNQLK